VADREISRFQREIELAIPDVTADFSSCSPDSVHALFKLFGDHA
jgi:hypothetical protein